MNTTISSLSKIAKKISRTAEPIIRDDTFTEIVSQYDSKGAWRTQWCKLCSTGIYIDTVRPKANFTCKSCSQSQKKNFNNFFIMSGNPSALY